MGQEKDTFTRMFLKSSFLESKSFKNSLKATAQTSCVKSPTGLKPMKQSVPWIDLTRSVLIYTASLHRKE